MVEEIWHDPKVNKQNVWKAYVDSYDNHAFGILQENCQNSFDAYPEKTDPRDMKVVIKYDSDNRILSHRDFGTRGMPHCKHCDWGILPNGKECEHTDCAWGCFHNMGYSAKLGPLLGSRGMGKCLQLLAGNRTIVTTTLPDEMWKASKWDKSHGDWQWTFSDDLSKKLSSPGTEIVTANIIDQVNEQLIDDQAVVAELQERWFRLLAEGATIEYILIRDGKIHRHIVRSPSLPDLDESQGPDKAHKVDPNIVVTYQGKKIGELKNLNLYLARKPFSGEDARWGIAIVKNGKQTIMRFKDFPEEIPESIRKRLFGFCDAICTDDEPFLKVAENAQHTAYQFSNYIYKAVRRQLRDIIKQFVQPFLKAGGERVSEAEQREARDILVVFNKALRNVPSFSLFGRSTGETRRKVETKPKTYPYLSRIEFEDRTYAKGESVPINAIVKNPTEKELFVRSVFEHYDPTPSVVEYQEIGSIAPAGKPDEPSTIAVSWSLTFDTSLASGIHWVGVTLRDAKNDPLIDDEGHPQSSRRALYCELERKKPVREKRSGTGNSTGEKGSGGGEGEMGLAGIQWFKKRDLRDSVEAYVDTSQAVAFVNYHGRRLEFVKNGAKSKKLYWPVVGELIAEKLLELKASLDASEKEAWSAEEVKNKIAELEQAKADFIRQMIGLLGSSD
ncbi:MAG: hypothetical protein JRN68_08615 [Nitrososphaerota archaeon]|nr:hypothetical protein [Nitrososphaerota archaeon]